MNVINQLIAQCLSGLSTKQKEELAQKLNVTRKTLDNISNGKSSPDFNTVTKLGDELKIDLLDRWKSANGRSSDPNQENEKPAAYEMRKPMIKVGLSVNVDEQSTASINDFFSDLKFLCIKYGYTLD
ncbi:helix-turn-helix domain-containing protein [Pedobacter sp.]